MFDIRDHGGSFGGTSNLTKAVVLDGVNALEIPSPVVMGQSIRLCKIFDDIAYTAENYDYIKKWRLDKKLKKWINEATFYVYPRTFTAEYNNVRPYATIFSKNNEYLYVTANFNNTYGTTISYCISLQINLNNHTVKQIGTHGTNWYDVPWVIYGDDKYFYYMLSGRTIKANASDLTEVMSVSGTVTWNRQRGSTQYQYYDKTRNEIFNVGTGGTSDNNYNGLQLSTLGFGNYKFPNDTRNVGDGGLWVDTGGFAWSIVTPVGGTNSSRILVKTQIEVGLANASYSNVSQLQNPNNFTRGLYFYNLLYYDKNTNLLWIRTTNVEGSYNYATGAYLVGIDVSTSPPTIKDYLSFGAKAPNDGNYYGMDYPLLQALNDNSSSGKTPFWYDPYNNRVSQLVRK